MMCDGAIHRYKPGVERHFLFMFAGAMWLGVGCLLLGFSCAWLRLHTGSEILVFAGSGLVAALLIHRFGFLKIVDRNVRRILPMEGKRCAFAFMSWKSYLLVAVMVAMGVALRHSSLPKTYLSVLYTGIGGALLLSSLRYWKVFLAHAR